RNAKALQFAHPCHSDSDTGQPALRENPCRRIDRQPFQEHTRVAPPPASQSKEAPGIPEDAPAPWPSKPRYLSELLRAGNLRPASKKDSSSKAKGAAFES